MSLIKPISFLQKEKIVVSPGGFPTLNGTVWDVWETDSGVVLSGTKVLSWTGNQNSRVMNNFATNTGPFLTTSDSNFNSQNSINFSRARIDGLFIDGANIQGTNAGSLHYCIYGITKYTSGATNAQFGFTSLGTPFNFMEAVLFVSSTTNSQIYRFNPSPTNGAYIDSNNDTLGKGIYTISLAPGTNASVYYNKGTTANATWSYSSYFTSRVRIALGAYNSSDADFAGSIDVVAAVVWYNSSNLTADITNLQTYFQTKYGA